MDNEEQQYEPLDNSVLQQIEADQARQNSMVTTVPEEGQPQQSAPQGEQQPQQPTPQQPQQAQPEKEESSDDQFLPQLAEGKADLGDYLRFGREMGGAPIAGGADFLVDAVNLIPKVDIPKLPKAQNDLAQTVRELSSIIVPTVLLSRAGIKGGKKVHGKVGHKAGNNALVKWLGEAGISTGVGVGVDWTSDLSQKDDNFLGSVKKMFPLSTQWVSDDWATLDSDSPELKREKTVREGAMMGIFSDLFSGFIALKHAIKGTKNFTSYIPENELASNYFKGEKTPEVSTPEDAFETSAKAREDALDEVAKEQLSRNVDLDSPVPGLTDSYDATEMGARSVDRHGVVGASVDAVRTQKNIDSRYGRLGSVITEGALKFGLGIEDLTRRNVVKMIKDHIRSAGKYSAELASGKKITFDEIDEAGTKLAEILVDPRMDTGTMKAVLDEYRDGVSAMSTRNPSLDDVGYNAAMKAIKVYMEEYVNPDLDKAAAYLSTSLGGQVSDIAEGARYMEGTEAVGRAQEMILDRLQYLMVEKGLAAYNAGSKLNFLNTWKRVSGNPRQLTDAAKAAKDTSDDALKNIVKRSETTIQTLREMNKERPEFLVPLQMAWEFSDGDINTLSKLNTFMEQSLTAIDKAFIDNMPEIPNQLVQGAWSNIYNSVLTSISTPVKAAFGNLGGMLSKPITVMAGAAVSGDWKTVRRGWYQYSAFTDTFQKSLKHMNMVFRKASTDPNSVGYIMRDDLVLKNEQTMDVLFSYAQAAERKGELGPMALYNMAETLHDLGNHPFLRFGTNAMTALDGFTRSFIAVGEARGRAWDKYIEGSGDLSGKTLKQAEDELYNSMFDKSGMITDKAVDYASREIALNLDNSGVQAISKFISEKPFLKPFIMFPRTSANMITMTNKYSPISVFLKDYNRIALPGQKFTTDEIKEILQSKGIEWTGNPKLDQQAFNTLKAEIRGRKAVGSMVIAGAVGMFMNDRLRGNGHFDKERQRVRTELGWKSRTYQGWDGNWYSYDGMGPVSDFIALVSDVMDHFDSIEQNDLQTTLSKLGFLISTNITARSTLAGLEPMNDVFSGNPAALSRWGASFGSSLIPLSGFRNELGRLIAPEMRELDMEFFQLLRNRNKFLDLIDPGTALPSKFDWIDGKKVGYADNFFVRGWNAIMPMKVAGDLTPERQFLIDIEYDSRPSFNKDEKGVEFSPEERSQLFSKMGEQKYFRDQIRRIMASTDAKEWRKQIKEQRRSGKQVDPRLWRSVYRQLDIAMRDAKRLAILAIDSDNEISRRQFQQSYNRVDQQMGRTPTFPLTNK